MSQHACSERELQGERAEARALWMSGSATLSIVGDPPHTDPATEPPLAWLDFRALGMSVPELSRWLYTSARVALRPSHWVGREGPGFARMNVAARPDVIADAADRIRRAVDTLNA